MLVVAIIADETFEQPHLVYASSHQEVGAAVAHYLRVTAPVTTSTGKRLDVPQIIAGEWIPYLQELLLDVEQIEVFWHCTHCDLDGAKLAPAATFRIWCSVNATPLSKQHAPLVVDVVADPTLL